MNKQVDALPTLWMKKEENKIFHTIFAFGYKLGQKKHHTCPHVPPLPSSHYMITCIATNHVQESASQDVITVSTPSLHIKFRFKDTKLTKQKMAPLNNLLALQQTTLQDLLTREYANYLKG